MDTSLIHNLMAGTVIHPSDYMDFLPRFLINLITTYIIAVKIYYSRRKNRDYLFTMFMFNLVIFIVCYLLSSNEMSIGFAFGLFAVFSILRYRTEQVPIREMTYIFVAISIAVINALGGEAISLTATVFANIVILSFVIYLERNWVQNTLFKNIRYEKIELIKPDRHEELVADLEGRTGLRIRRVEVGDINFLNDTANLTVYYYDPDIDVLDSK